ncbi:hypothetical protein CC85DRAFT_244040 [Cutaneotrichosporon oleaginosum]|uniref:Fe2OG dioxygenase domain-containing protein n=1 Tax=Cutaneotrichosporon oleaginosum TaxID=879819 RepID=A0A0J0XQW4_9TREE|nr:uncharacterized protein CC85DRAFT_244040 [Cutaneotrichosporon oleaginosum]KLT43465.1 hypothetical protein CC85DRAFT_244040 [Cutaneotrichosporon oleaginosum]TXT05629.1 hypothetical protein COLE_06949 [Cutaneotrichosporon oleaginosum]
MPPKRKAPPVTASRKRARASSSLSPPPSEPAEQPSPEGRVTGFDQFRVPLLEGDVLYIPDFLPPADAEGLYAALAALPDWHHPTLRIYNRAVQQSRAVAVYASSPRTIKYSGTEIRAHAFPPVLERVRRTVEARLAQRFDVCMLNRYDDGGVYIGRHSDTCENLIIASLSLGAARSFVMTPRMPPRAAGGEGEERRRELEARETVRFTMQDRSLVVMQGKTQDYWKHEIPKERRVKEGRISLTFRQT